MLPSSPAG